MRARALLALAFSMAALLAGCSGSGGGPQADPTQEAAANQASTAPVVGANAKPMPTPEAIPVDFDGSLGTSAHGCVFPAGVCHTQAVQPDTSDLLLERPGTNLTALALDVTWTAATPGTATLAVGYMVMATCEGCNSTFLGEVQGSSPLRIDLSGVDVPLSADAVVHVYAYNPTGVVVPPGDAGYAVLSAQQAFHIEGTVTVAVPSGAAAASASTPSSPGA